MSNKRQKRRIAFRKNRGKRTRPQNLTREALDEAAAPGLERAGIGRDERLSGKGGVTRHRTVLADDETGAIVIDEEACEPGRVLRAIGSTRCRVKLDRSGDELECTVRRVVRTMERETRNAVVAGDRVQVRPLDEDAPVGVSDGGEAAERQGVIERVEPRLSELSRTSGRFAHLIAANVDQVVIVGSAADPPLKPTLIDRFIVAAEKGNIRPVICINKADLADRIELIRVTGIYGQLGYRTLLTSATTGEGIDDLRSVLRGNESVFAGQSGVGKTSLLNEVQPGLALKTATVAGDTRKGRHTTRVAELRPLRIGAAAGRTNEKDGPRDSGEQEDVEGWVVDTPGVRQMDLWGIEPGEVEGYFREFRPLVAQCRFPDCSHTHEDECGVKRAVELGMVSPSRYHGYVRILTGEFERGEH